MAFRGKTNKEAEAPPEAPRTVQEFRSRLGELHRECGSPANAEIRRAIRCVNVPQVAASTLSEFFNGLRPTVLPRQDFVRGFVTGCLLHSGASMVTVTEALDQWDGWWSAVVASTGQPPIKVDTRVEAPQTDIVDSWWQRPLTLGIATVCTLLGFSAGALWFGWDELWSAHDPSLAYDTCGEKLAPSPVAGQIVLIADRGPHGRPIQDRRIELRLQDHPQHGWILWAHLAATPSDVDRLWMDWSYQQNPASMADFRQCGAQPVSDGRDTPALLARDSQGTPRWFRACGQVYPLEQRAPNASGTYCTSWTRPSA
jgi:hypothetical protein